jgi:hypothetical protein
MGAAVFFFRDIKTGAEEEKMLKPSDFLSRKNIPDTRKLDESAAHLVQDQIRRKPHISRSPPPEPTNLGPAPRSMSYAFAGIFILCFVGFFVGLYFLVPWVANAIVSVISILTAHL